MERDPQHAVRRAQPHPPALLPRMLAGSPYAPAAGEALDPAVARYEALASAQFANLPTDLDEAELTWLQRYHQARLELEREERRAHFGALMLVGILFFLLFPVLVARSFADLWLDVLALLLLSLIVPYVFVYFGYENRVRAMSVGALRLLARQAPRTGSK